MKLGERTLQDRWVGVGYNEGWRGSPYSDYSDSRNGVSFAWRAPRWIPDAPQEPGSGLGPATVWHLEVAVYPRISCRDAASRWSEDKPDTRQSPHPLLGTPEDLASLGKPEQVRRIWVSSVQDNGQYPFGGPAWMESLLRERSMGGTWLVPPSQNCREMTEGIPLGLPVHVFGSGDPIGDFPISARSPFTVRVMEACLAAPEQHIRKLRSYHIPLWTFGYSIGTTVDRTLTTVRLRAQCASREVRFEYGPFGGSNALGDPSPQFKMTGGEA